MRTELEFCAVIGPDITMHYVVCPNGIRHQHAQSSKNKQDHNACEQHHAASIVLVVLLQVDLQVCSMQDWLVVRKMFVGGSGRPSIRTYCSDRDQEVRMRNSTVRVKNCTVALDLFYFCKSNSSLCYCFRHILIIFYY